MKKHLSLSAIILLLLSTFASIAVNPTARAQPNATLTGKIYDHGLDTDMDILFNFLIVEVEVNVSVAGIFHVQIDNLRDEYYSSVYFYSENETYLDLGVHNVTISFEGIPLYGSRISITHVVEVSLMYTVDNTRYQEIIPEIALSKTYNYTDFDTGATLTGTISDAGVDTDGDGFFNFLELNVEINVTDSAEYEVFVSGLEDGTYVSVFNYSRFYLPLGIQTVNISLHGAKIYASKANVSAVAYIRIEFVGHHQPYWLDDKVYIPLNRTYEYDEFDCLAFFTGTILDEGIDNDGDGLFDYLKISVEINITEAGFYKIEAWNLFDGGTTYIDVPGVKKTFDLGVHLVNFTVYGPRIYVTRVDTVFIGPVTLEYSLNEEWVLLETRDSVPLPTTYHYFEFESHAFLTGKVYDSGVDTDMDQLFDYLEVGVEVNVTEAGTYQISVDGLVDELGTKYISYEGEPFADHLELGIHMINFTFPGSKIAYYHINPANITYLELKETYAPYTVLGLIESVGLTTEYNYTQFNSPFNDIQIQLTIFPNATLGVNGSLNHTHAYPPFYNEPLINATLGFSTDGDSTMGSVNGTMMLPHDSMEEFPLNSTNVDFASEYYGNMLNARLNGTVFMPIGASTNYPFNSSDFWLLATYSDGMLNLDLWGETNLPPFYASQFPFNLTDVTVLADYSGGKIEGNITYHAVSGFPLADIVVYFEGNKTEISFSGSIDVVYGNYFGMEINATTLEEMLVEINSTIPGRGENSLYNMSEGTIECTILNTTKTPIGDPETGARVDYNATICGNFTKLLATYVTDMIFESSAPEEAHSVVYAALDATHSSIDDASLVLSYYHSSGIADMDLTLNCNVKTLWTNALELIPPTLPPENRSQLEAWLKIANITCYSLKNANVEVIYSSTEQRLEFNASLTANVTLLENEIIPVLPDAVPPEIRDLVESCTNTTFCTLESFNATCKYTNGLADFYAKWLLKGDFKKEINLIKNCYVEYLNLTSPDTITGQILMLNATEIDISDFAANIRQGKDWMTLTFQGLKLHPAIDKIDFVRFKLYRFFNMTTDPHESPREFEKLRIALQGGSNATHTVLLQAASTMPSPNMTSLNYKYMIWENVTMSSLKEMLFKIAYQEVISYLGEDYDVLIFTNSTVSSFGFVPEAKRISFNVTGTTGRGFCNVTIPRALLYAEPYWTVRVDGVELLPGEYNITENLDYVFIYIEYSHSTHAIEIEGNWIITEFPPHLLPLALIIASIVAIIFVIRQRNRSNELRTDLKNRQPIY